MSGDTYLKTILARETVDTGPFSAVRNAHTTIEPLVRAWAGAYLLSVAPSGSFAKGTAIRSGTDLDLFISLSENTPETLKQVYDKLHQRMTELGYVPRKQNVSIGVTVAGHQVDLVPAKRQSFLATDHSLYRRKADSWTKTNVATHINTVIAGGRRDETRILKLWRNQKKLEFPSFYLELTVIAALTGKYGTISQNVWTVFEYLRDRFANARVVDPANTNNIISDDMTVVERGAVVAAARNALAQGDWSGIVV